eukprot:6491110-Amphidinium_carterae.1
MPLPLKMAMLILSPSSTGSTQCQRLAGNATQRLRGSKYRPRNDTPTSSCGRVTPSGASWLPSASSTQMRPPVYSPHAQTQFNVSAAFLRSLCMAKLSPGRSTLIMNDANS